MSRVVRFASFEKYDAGLSSITIPIELRIGGECAEVRAKIDTGASHCIFGREIGEMLDLTSTRGESCAWKL